MERLGDVRSILESIVEHFVSFLDHFWVMLGLGGPSWGPLASFGAILRSTSDFDAIFDQIREKKESILGPFLGVFCVC